MLGKRFFAWPQSFSCYRFKMGADQRATCSQSVYRLASPLKSAQSFYILCPARGGQKPGRIPTIPKPFESLLLLFLKFVALFPESCWSCWAVNIVIPGGPMLAIVSSKLNEIWTSILVEPVPQHAPG